MSCPRPLLRKPLIAAFLPAAAQNLLHDIEAAGTLFLGGNLTDLDGSSTGMLAALRAPNFTAAREILGGAAQRLAVWTINEGRLALDLAFSRRCLAGSCDSETFLIETRCAYGERLELALAAHMEHQFALEDRGVLLAAGPTNDSHGGAAGRSGLIVFHAADATKARLLAAADPMHASGARTYTILRWRITHGCLSVRVRLSDRSFHLE